MGKEFKTWEILKKGNYPEGIIDDEILNDIVATFGKRGDIPIGIGHEQYWWRDDLPAEGYLRKNQEFGLSKNGSFVSKGVDLLAGLKEAYEEERYAKWSAVIGRSPIMKETGERTGKYTKWELFAVDVLGRTPPAIKGLRDLTGKKAEELSKFGVSFSEDNEKVIFLHGKELEIMSFSGDFTTDNNEENEMTAEKLEKLQKQLDGFEAKFTASENKNLELSGKMEALETEKTNLVTELASSKAQIEETEKIYKDGQIEVLKNSTKMLPKEMSEKLFSAIDSVAGNKISFSSGDKKVSIYSVFAECLIQAVSVSSENPTFSMDTEFSETVLPEITKAENEGKEILLSSSESIEML